ncbi:MAG: DUF3500 domain-containing protein [Propionibacteriales bacterium]|nr:DUF3500 domain-containing protein [Propionibacteriales bacterium]
MTDLVRRMREAATAFTDALTAGQRDEATARFDIPDHDRWTYLPGPRPGLAIAALDDEQRGLAFDLLATAYSTRGHTDALAVVRVESIRRELQQSGTQTVDPYTDLRYWVRVLGDPRGAEPWAWRVNGHHLAAHATVVGDQVTGTPQFFGAEPARVPTGPHTGFRPLAREEDLARRLVDALGNDQRRVAVSGPVAPRDIRTRFDPVASTAVVPPGLRHDQMDREQRDLLEAVVRQYLDRAAGPVADRAWTDILDAGRGEVAFTWAGDTAPGAGHYYAVTGPSFLLEYDNTQDDANHIHSVWRDLRHDWGGDLLAQHYAALEH